MLFVRKKKRIYARHNLTPKIRNQELAIASFRCMQRQELIDEFAQNTASFIKEAKQYFQQSGYSIRSLEEIDMATKAGQKLQDLQPNSIAPATKELEREGEKKACLIVFLIECVSKIHLIKKTLNLNKITTPKIFMQRNQARRSAPIIEAIFNLKILLSKNP